MGPSASREEATVGFGFESFGFFLSRHPASLLLRRGLKVRRGATDRRPAPDTSAATSLARRRRRRRSVLTARREPFRCSGASPLPRGGTTTPWMRKERTKNGNGDGRSTSTTEPGGGTRGTSERPKEVRGDRRVAREERAVSARPPRRTTTSTRAKPAHWAPENINIFQVFNNTETLSSSEAHSEPHTLALRINCMILLLFHFSRGKGTGTGMVVSKFSRFGFS